MVYCPQAVTHPSTNPDRCRATLLIEHNALPLRHAANPFITVSSACEMLVETQVTKTIIATCFAADH